MSVLSEIQTQLRAPKGQKNEFGGYQYRSAEDILAAVKPLMAATDTSLTMSDEVVEVGGRVYVKATVSFRDPAGGVIETSAFAREQEVKKGMDQAQITGSASSYARKYALNGMFAIDNTPDPDTMDNRNTAEDALRGAKTLDSLRKVWGGLSTAEKKTHMALKNELVESLS